MVQLYNLLTGLGDRLATFGEEQRKRQMLSDLGNDISGGDYKTAARKALASGDIRTGLSLLELGQQQQLLTNQKEADAAALGGIGGAASGSVTPGQSSYRDAIASIESKGSGDYNALGPLTNGDRAYGRYQVMGKNIPQWTKQALGYEMTPEQFLASPEAQNKVFDTIFGGYVQKYGNPQDAASVWFTGKPLAQGAGRADVNGMTGRRYVDKFTGALGGGRPVQVADASGAIPASAVPSSADGGSDRISMLESRKADLERRLFIKDISPATKQSLQLMLSSVDREIDRETRNQDRAQSRKDAEDRRRESDPQYQYEKRMELGKKAGLQGEDLNNYALSGKTPAAATEKAPTGEQAKASGFAERMAAANERLNDPKFYSSAMGASGRANQMAGAVPFGLARGAQSAEYQQYRRAVSDFITAKLRDESGATIGTPEFQRDEETFFPQPGDSPAVIRDKAEARKRVIAAEAGNATPAFQKTFFSKWKDYAPNSGSASPEQGRSGIQDLLKKLPPERAAKAQKALQLGAPESEVMRALGVQ